MRPCFQCRVSDEGMVRCGRVPEGGTCTAAVVRRAAADTGEAAQHTVRWPGMRGLEVQNVVCRVTVSGVRHRTCWVAGHPNRGAGGSSGTFVCCVPRTVDLHAEVVKVVQEIYRGHLCAVCGVRVRCTAPYRLHGS